MGRKIVLLFAVVGAAAGLAGCGLMMKSEEKITGTAFGMTGNLPPADGSPLEGSPGFFVRAGGSVQWTNDATIVHPAVLDRIDYEGELVVVIGKEASRVTPEEAAECIAGYTCGMDGSPQVFDADGEKDIVRSVTGKSVDGVAPVAPQLAESLDPEGHDIVLRINGEEVERANTKDHVWDPPRMVAEISRTVTLYPGDVIFGGARTAIPQLRPGDTFEVELVGVSKLQGKVVAE